MILKVLKLNSSISSFFSMSQTYMCTFKTTVLCNGFGFTDVFTISLCVKTTKQFLINLC